jgi:hypothetical protein
MNVTSNICGDPIDAVHLPCGGGLSGMVQGK